MKRLTTEEFIAKATSIHGDRYDYSQTNYVSAIQNVIIICKTHGAFTQRPHNHIQNKGCNVCANSIRTKKKILSGQMILDRFKKIHGNRYDYSQVVYDNIDVPVKIICPDHGSFMQSPRTHCRGSGCQKCGSIRSNNNKFSTLEEILSKFADAHGGRYDYSQMNYIKQTTKVSIICKIHGTFDQLPVNHMRGVGCPKCSNRGGIGTKIYLVEFETATEHFAKIGIMANSVDTRFRGWRNHVLLKPHIIVDCGSNMIARILEASLLAMIPDDMRVCPDILRQRWHGWTECFDVSLIPDMVLSIETLTDRESRSNPSPDNEDGSL